MSMLDRSIPYYNTILKCSHWEKTAVRLPEGCRIRGFLPGDETAWARLEHEIGDFASLDEALSYFTKTYRETDRVFFAEENGETVGSVIAWRDRRGAGTAASLHWLIVAPRCQGKGLGKALLQTAMNWYLEAGELPVYLHTQPWSYKAILLYVKNGFRLQKSDSFSRYENQYADAMRTLQDILPPRDYTALLRASED